MASYVGVLHTLNGFRNCQEGLFYAGLIEARCAGAAQFAQEGPANTSKFKGFQPTS